MPNSEKHLYVTRFRNCDTPTRFSSAHQKLMNQGGYSTRKDNETEFRAVFLNNGAAKSQYRQSPDKYTKVEICVTPGSDEISRDVTA